MSQSAEVQAAEKLMGILERMVSLYQELHPREDRRASDRKVTKHMQCWTCASEKETPIGSLRQPVVFDPIMLAHHRGHMVEVML